MEYYKNVILNSLKEDENNNDFPYQDGIIVNMVSPGMYRNETQGKFLNKMDEDFIEFLSDITRVNNLWRPSVKENEI